VTVFVCPITVTITEMDEKEKTQKTRSGREFGKIVHSVE